MPSGEAKRAGPPRTLIAVVVATLVLRLIVGGLTHLTEDEAYYRLWSMAPAFGYFDHPPMIAWWIWLGRHITGDTALGVRLLPILASAVTSALIFDMAALAGADRQVSERAGVWFNATLLVLAGGFLAVPDAPASLFWSLALWCALKAQRRAALGWWALAGVSAGLAALSKYSALFIGPGVLIWLASSSTGRAQLKTAGPWIACLIAAAVFSANIGWNAEHHWLTFDKQFGRVAPGHFAPRYLLEFIAGQAILLNPLIALFIGVALAVRPRSGRSDADLSPFLALSAPFIAYLLFHSLHDRVQAHWPAPLYPLLSIIAAVGAQRVDGAWRGLRCAAPAFGFALGGAALLLLAAPGGALGRYDLALPVRGWNAFADRIETLRRQSGAAWIGTASYGVASQLADESAVHAPVFQLTERERWNGFSDGPTPDIAAPGLTIDLTRRMNAVSLGRCFTVVTSLGVLARGDSGEPGKAYSVYRVSGPKRDILSLGC